MPSIFTPSQKVIGVLTTFSNFDSAYSLTSVVRDQLTALVKYGYKTVLFVLPTFRDDPRVPVGVEIRKIVPQLILEPYKEFSYPDHWKEDVKKAREMFEKNMRDITHLICHDIFFIDTYLPYNIALRESLDALPDLRILAWTHSAPSGQAALRDNQHANRYMLPPRTRLVYLNHVDAQRLAEHYGAWLKDVRVVHNPRDPRTFWNLDPLTVNLIDRYNLLEKDIVSVYPLSTPRMIDGKGLDKAIKLHSKLKQIGYKTCLVVPNAHANAEKEKRLINQTQFFASDLGVDTTELVFTSLEEPPKYELGVTPKVISDLFRLSNIFVFPTVSENCSLILLEAELSGNLLVLNERVRSLAEFGREHALYLNFEYREQKEENEKYYTELAMIVGSAFENDRALQVKRSTLQRHNYDYIFKKQLEPLFYEDH